MSLFLKTKPCATKVSAPAIFALVLAQGYINHRIPSSYGIAFTAVSENLAHVLLSRLKMFENKIK